MFDSLGEFGGQAHNDPLSGELEFFVLTETQELIVGQVRESDQFEEVNFLLFGEGFDVAPSSVLLVDVCLLEV